MGVWIKTQEGNLIYCDSILRCSTYECRNRDETKTIWCIVATSHNNHLQLGEYSSEERVEEVINMIQDHIDRWEYFKVTGDAYEYPKAFVVFEMPEE